MPPGRVTTGTVYTIQHWDSGAAGRRRGELCSLSSPNRILAGGPYVYRDESDLHWTLGGLLQDARVPLRHEVRLAPGNEDRFRQPAASTSRSRRSAARADLATAKQLLRYSGTGAVKAILPRQHPCESTGALPPLAEPDERPVQSLGHQRGRA